MHPTDHFIFDGTHVLYRAAYRTGHVPGEPQRAGWGPECVADALREIERVLAKFQPSSGYMVFDGGKSARRLALFPEYKQQRNHDEVDRQGLRASTTLLATFAKKLGFHVLVLPGREADDVVALLVREFLGGTVVSSDQDFLQLVVRGAAVYLLSSRTFVNGMFFREYSGGISPTQFLLTRAMGGDVSDGISGVPGLGYATASDILKKLDVSDLPSLKAAVEAVEKPKKRLLTLRESWAIVERNLQLMDLSLEEFSDAEVSTVRACMRREVRVDPTVVDDLHKHDLHRLAHLFDSWSRPFYSLNS
jgi:5'-3' exonuclease